MPLTGQLKEGFWEGSSPSRQRFASMLSKLIDSMPVEGEERKAARLEVHPSTLSCYRHARRMPLPHQIRKLYSDVIRHTPTGVVPVKLEDLLELRDIAAATRVATLAPVSAVPDEPAAEDPSTAVLPGKRKDGDRRSDRHSGESTPAGKTADVMVAHQAAGRRQDVLNLISATVSTAAPRQVAETIRELCRRQQPGLAEALLANGRKRSHADVMRLALALMAAGLTDYAETAMRASLMTDTA
ncbi:hypothetical protein AB0I49_16765 [Streptomyces sp. NPDC050617]|uniref:hypothetical protein n=1 Tax=Streptomyces sp. NPDC050617 TaxID=3154628 RepID=UPI00341EA4B0